MHQTNEIGSNETVVSSPVERMTSAPNIEQCNSFNLNAFDLWRVGLSSTLAITIFVIIGHVVRYVAGPSAILSVILAAFLAILIGTTYTTYMNNGQCTNHLLKYKLMLVTAICKFSGK